jgi:ribosomal RNA-processing protein 12
MGDLFGDLRRSSARQQEQAILAAVDEIIDSQSLSRTPVAYLGVIMMSLEAQDGAEPPVFTGMLALLERTLSSQQIPKALLLSKAPRISAALVGVANAHSDQIAVLCGALSCAGRLLSSMLPSAGARLPSDSLKLFNWLLAFVVHIEPQVRARGHQVCCSALDQCAALSPTAAQFVEGQLAAAAMKDVQPALYVLAFLLRGQASFAAGPLESVTRTVMRLLGLGHPLLSRTAADVLVELCSSDGVVLPPTLLVAIMELPLHPAGTKHGANIDPGALRAAAAAAVGLLDVDPSGCHARLAPLCTAWVRALWHHTVEGASGGSSEKEEGTIAPAELYDLVGNCVRSQMPSESAEALASAFVSLLEPRYAPLRGVVLEACASLFTGLGQASSPSCDALIKVMAKLYADATLGSARPVLVSSLGQAAKAIGPARFVELLPIRISTDGGADTSWLLSTMRNHVGNAKLAFFVSYFVPLTQWLEQRVEVMESEKREIEARNLRNLYEQVWALLPGFSACARDVAESLPHVARLMGSALTERPEVRGHVLQALTLFVQTARSRKEPAVVGADGSLDKGAVAPGGGGGVTLVLTADARATLDTVGRFGKNFLPVLFNVHQAEPPQKRPALQEAVTAVASVTPTETLGELFKVMVRKFLEPGTVASASSTLEEQRGLLDLLIAVSPSLSEAHVDMLSRAVRPTLLSTDVLLQKKAYKVLSALGTHHPNWVRNELPTLRSTMSEALPACAPGCKGKRLACLQAVAGALPDVQLTEFLPALLGEVVLATRELNVKTRAAAFELLVGVAETASRRSPDGAESLRSLLMMIAGGLAGTTPHMIAASLAALGRLVFEFQGRPALETSLVGLFSAVLTLLEHNAQEVVKAALSFCKVGLHVLPPEAVRPLLPRLVPPMLVWCTNKHPHLKTQIRYVMERLVKRFGQEEMAMVTPEAHQRLLVHMRKQKVRAHNHAVARRALRDERKAADANWADDEQERDARSKRHAEYEAIFEDEAELSDGDAEDGPSNASGDGKSPRRLRAAAAAAAFASKYGKGGLHSTWMDASESAADLDMLSAPLVSFPGGTKKRGRDTRAVPDTTAASASATRPGVGTGDEDDAAIHFDEDGKVVIREKPEADMNIDEDEGHQSRSTKRQRKAAENGSEAESAYIAVAKQAAATVAREGSGSASERRKRDVKVRDSGDRFGAQFGEQYKGKKGAAGDSLRKDAAGGYQPFAYLPLAPRLLGKKQQRHAAGAFDQLIGPSGKAAKKTGVRSGMGKNSRVGGKHGLQARRGRK